ncbi:FkbM family methyltransferase [Amycolatopsis suaedae]|nr:FkbM family methyltransferase [Amycolatopsis suaedae]
MSELNLVEIEGGLKCYTPAGHNPVLTEAGLIYEEIFRRNVYLRGLNPIDPGGVVVDAGANIGLFTLFVKRHFPSASVLAVEPIPHNVAALRANLDLYSVAGVTVCPVGLSDQDGSARFYFFPSMPGNSTAHLANKLKDRETVATYATTEIAEQVYRHEEVDVAVRRLSDLLRDSPHASGDIELVKMDIEGSEQAALAGLDDGDWARIKQFAIEVHGAQDAVEAVLELLRGKGFTAQAQAESHSPRGIDSRLVYARRQPA